MKARHQVTYRFFSVALHIAFSASGLLAQEGSKADVPAFHIPRTATLMPVTCSDTSSLWKDASWITLSGNSIDPSLATADRPVAVLGNMTDLEKPIASLPQVVQDKLASYQVRYAFKWDDDRLYGYVEIQEPNIDTNHLGVSEPAFRASPTEAAWNDLFYSTVVVEVGAPSWQRWTTEMHVHVRPPNAKPMKAMFYGRTNDEEDFHPLRGEAIACPAQGGWIAKFSLVWLPYTDWHPKLGVPANLRLLVPLAHAHEGYVIATVVPIVLTNK